MSLPTILTSKSIILKDLLPSGPPQPEHFDITSEEIDVDALKGTLVDGDIIVQLLTISADPYLRGQIRPGGRGTAQSPMFGFVAGRVLASHNNEKWAEGDLFGSNLKFITIQKLSAADLAQTLIWKLTGLLDESQISRGIVVLGMPGSTAYGGLIDVLRPKEGETIFISAASGAVGSLVGMLAKTLYNCKVIGSCGGPEKCALIKEKFGFDAAIDYKTIDDADGLIAALKEVAPDGIDMYFENVGGIHFTAALASLRPYGRVAVCGQISEYNNEKAAPCEVFPMKMIYTFQRIEGFMCSPWLSGAKGQFLADMSKWLGEGKLQVQETFFDGAESWPLAFQSLFTGANVGKVVVRV